MTRRIGKLSDPSPAARRQRIRLGLFSGSLVLLLCAAQVSLVEAASVSSNFRVISHHTVMAAGKSRSNSFALDSCVDNVMAGQSTSSKFRLQSGCGAAFGESFVGFAKQMLGLHAPGNLPLQR